MSLEVEVGVETNTTTSQKQTVKMGLKNAIYARINGGADTAQELQTLMKKAFSSRNGSARKLRQDAGFLDEIGCHYFLNKNLSNAVAQVLHLYIPRIQDLENKISAKNMKVQNMKVQNMKVRNMKVRNMKVRNMKVQNMKAKNMKGETAFHCTEEEQDCDTLSKPKLYRQDGWGKLRNQHDDTKFEI